MLVWNNRFGSANEIKAFHYVTNNTLRGRTTTANIYLVAFLLMLDLDLVREVLIHDKCLHFKVFLGELKNPSTMLHTTNQLLSGSYPSAGP